MRTKSYILEDYQIAAIQQVAKDHGETSESAALRFIIDEYARLIAKQERQRLPYQQLRKTPSRSQ